MPKLFVLVKRTSAKNWSAAIPAKAGVTRSRLTSVIKKSRKKDYSYKIVSSASLKSLIKRKNSKPRKKRTTKRKKVTRRRKRK